jgi:DMSO/TMAO reductase YedYZ molybdopterin-dependent catalytic subunit
MLQFFQGKPKSEKYGTDPENQSPDLRTSGTGLPTSGPGLGRRLFLKASALAGFLLCTPSSAWTFFSKQFQTRTVEKENFRFDPATGNVVWTDKKKSEPYYLIIDGLVEKPSRFSYAELKSLPQTVQASDFHCVEGWSVENVRWNGIRFQEISRRVNLKPEAKFAVFHSLGETGDKPGGLDHYIESFPVADLLDPKKECLLALSLDGKPLSHDRGAPLRVVSPFDLGYKGSKYVARIEFAKEARPGWWTLANPIYPVNAPVPSSRLRKK